MAYEVLSIMLFHSSAFSDNNCEQIVDYSSVFGMGKQNTNEFSNLCSEKENTYYGVDVNDEFSFPTPAPDVFCSSDESIISPSVTSSPLPVGSCYLHESTYGMQTSVSPIPTLDTSDNAVPDQFCSSSSSTIADSTITNELNVSSPIASPSYPPLFSSPSYPFLSSLPLYLHSPYPFFCIQPISLKVCKQKNSNARGDSLSHIYLQLRNLCKNRECLQNCPLNTRKEFCLTSCKFRRGNYLKERLSINRGKLHSRYVLERHIEMGVAGTVLEDRRKELQAINDVITMERKSVKRQVNSKVKKGKGKGKGK